MAKRPGPQSRTYIDENKARVQREAKEKLSEILVYGTETDFVAAVKAWKKDIHPEELQEWIKLFRACVREKRGLG